MKKITLISVLITLLFASFIELAIKVQDFQLEKIEKLEAISNDVDQFKKVLLFDRERNRRINLAATVAKGFNAAISDSVIEEIVEMSYKYSDNLSVELICATVTHESALTWHPEIESPVGAIGLMQIMPATGMYLASLEGITWTSAEEVLTNPIYNIRMGTRYLSYLVECYGIEGGLAAYNGGEKRARKYVANNLDPEELHEETRGYIPAVLKWHSKYEQSI